MILYRCPFGSVNSCICSRDQSFYKLPIRPPVNAIPYDPQACLCGRVNGATRITYIPTHDRDLLINFRQNPRWARSATLNSPYCGLKGFHGLRNASEAPQEARSDIECRDLTIRL